MPTESLYPHMVQEYYVARLREVARRRSEDLAKVRTRAQVLRLRAKARRKLRRCFGPLPGRTDLRAVTTGVIRSRQYSVENVIYESRPGFRVTANLYVPRGDGPFPVVLAPCGHTRNGKAAEPYQAYATGLARRGYMVLVYDPQGQGERVQITRAIGPYRPGDCCHEHNQFGNRLALLGGFFGTWRTWDGIRGLDYLLARPEADRTRVGVTGNSGGGTLTTYVSALDDRVTMAAPSCFVTTFLCNIENELPSDSEQTPPGILAAGMDFADFFIAQIPRPVLLLGQRDDFFDVRGLRQTYEELKRLYAILGEEDKVRLFVGSHGHGYFSDNRHAMYRFFARHSGRPASVRPSESKARPDEKLLATPEGSVLKAGSRGMATLLREQAREVCAARPAPGAARLKDAIRDVLALPPAAGVPHYRVLRQQWSNSPRHQRHSMFAVETEPGIQAIVHSYGTEQIVRLPKRDGAVVFVPHLSSMDDVDAGDCPGSRQLLAVDVRGIGLSQARTSERDEFLAPYGNDYMYAACGQMLAEPYLGRRVHDLLRVLDLLAAGRCRGIHLVGRGLGAVTATFAACLHSAVRRVTLHNAPASYAQMMERPVCTWPRSAMAYGLLERLDLPDCYRLLKRTKRLRLIDPWDHLMHPASGGAALPQERR